MSRSLRAPACVGVIRRTLEPEWRETFEFRGMLDAFLSSGGVRLQVFDWDELGMHDVLGEVRVKLPPELRTQAGPPAATHYFERLTPEGKLEFSVTWAPDARLPAACGGGWAATRPLGASAARTPAHPVPVLLPSKFDYLTDFYGPGRRPPSAGFFAPEAFCHVSELWKRTSHSAVQGRQRRPDAASSVVP